MSVSKPRSPRIIIAVVLGFLLLMMIPFLVVIVVVVRGFLADQSQFSQPVPASIVDVTEAGKSGASYLQDHIFYYTYEVEGTTYASKATIVDGERSERDPLTVCVDPDDDPARHVALIKEDRQCGDKRVGSTSTAEKVD